MTRGFALQDGCCAEPGASATGFAAAVVSAASFADALSCAGTFPAVAGAVTLGDAGAVAPGEAVPCATECPDDPGPTATATANTNPIPEAALSEK
jgi:hypothetical protein